MSSKTNDSSVTCFLAPAMPFAKSLRCHPAGMIPAGDSFMHAGRPSSVFMFGDFPFIYHGRASASPMHDCILLAYHASSVGSQFSCQLPSICPGDLVPRLCLDSLIKHSSLQHAHSAASRLCPVSGNPSSSALGPAGYPGLRPP